MNRSQIQRRAIAKTRKPFPLLRGEKAGIGASFLILALPREFMEGRAVFSKKTAPKGGLKGGLKTCRLVPVFDYFRRRRANMPAAPKPARASVAGSGTGSSVMLLKVMSYVPTTLPGSIVRLSPSIVAPAAILA